MTKGNGGREQPPKSFSPKKIIKYIRQAKIH